MNYYKKLITVSTFSVAALVFALALPAQTLAYSFSTQLDLGASGPDVTALQQYLAADSSLYPQGLVTGYFGSLTAAAVSRFQTRYGLQAVGRVGPLTLAKLNELSGGVTTATGPIILGVGFNNPSTGMETVNVSANVATRVKVFYDTSSLAATETSANFSEPAIGGLMVADSNFSTSHVVTLSNLARGITYYYRVLTADQSGNVAVTTQGTFNPSF